MAHKFLPVILTAMMFATWFSFWGNRGTFASHNFTFSPVNLLQNGSFEDGLKGWQVVGRVSLDKAVRHTGNFSAIVQRSASEREQVWWGIQQEVEVRPDSPYQLSLWLRQQDAKAVHVKLRWLDEAGKEVSTSWVRGGVDGTHDWQKILCQLVAPKGACRAEVIIWCWYPDKGEGKVWVDGVKLVSRAMRQVSHQEAIEFLKSGGKPRIAFVGLGNFPILDRTYRKRLYELGYTCDFYSLRQLREGQMPLMFQNCNVVAFTQFSVDEWPLSEGSNEQIWQWVENGGGLLFIAGLCGYGDYDALVGNLNRLLAPFDARIVFEQVTDEQNKEVHDRGVINYTYYWTDNINPEHLICKGIQRLWYPGGGGQHAAPTPTYTMAVGNGWKILVRGNRSAHSKTYRSEPPLVAVREYGKGRVAIATFDPRYSINDGYHPAYGGFVEKGDFFRFLCQLYDWLGEPSILSGKVYSEEYEDLPTLAVKPHPDYEPVPDADSQSLMEKIKTAQSLNTYRGVVGVHSNLSDGEDDPESFCREARDLGYDFIVFTESYEKMDESKWERLVDVCRQESSERFLAIPGLQIKAPDGERVVFNLSRFFRADETTNMPALLFNLNWPTIVLVQPNRNKRNAWQNKFYTGLALFTYERGRLVDDATALYRQLSASDYRLIPVAVNKVYSLQELRATRAQVITVVNAKSPAELVEHPDWQHEGPLRTFYGCGSSYVSSGPILERFGVATKEGVRSYAGGYAVYPGHKELITFSIRSDAQLEEVAIFKGDYLFRRFFPNSNEFSSFVWSVCDRNDVPVSIFAKDGDGRMLHSNSLRKPYNPFFSYSMCVDKQNSIFELGDLGMTCGWIAGLDVGAIFPLIPPHEIVPAGEDASWCPISSFEMRPNFHLSEPEFRRLADMPESQEVGWEPLIYESRRCLLSSSDCVVTEETYEKAFVSATIRCLYFRPRPYGISTIFIEQDIKLKKDIPVSDNGVTLLRIMSNTAINLYPRFVFRDDKGRTEDGSAIPAELKNGFTLLRQVNLGRGSYLCLYGLPTGAVAIFPLSPQHFEGIVGITTDALHAFVSGKRPHRNILEIRINTASKIVNAGTEWKTKFLFILDNRRQWQPEHLNELAQIYCSENEGLALKVSALYGEIDRSRICPPTIKAKDGYAMITVEDKGLPFGLPVIVKGLNRNWDAVVCDLQLKELRRIGVVEDEGYVLFDGSRKGTYFIGNLIECDNPEIRLTVEEVDGNGIRFTMHNPTGRAITAIFQPSEGLKWFPAFRRRVTLQPGACLTMTVPRLK